MIQKLTSHAVLTWFMLGFSAHLIATDELAQQDSRDVDNAMAAGITANSIVLLMSASCRLTHVMLVVSVKFQVLSTSLSLSTLSTASLTELNWSSCYTDKNQCKKTFQFITQCKVT